MVILGNAGLRADDRIAEVFGISWFMSDELSARINTHFASLTDPRRRKVTYPLVNIVTIALCAVIAGADDFVTIAAWGRQKRAWLARLLDLSSGIPIGVAISDTVHGGKPCDDVRYYILSRRLNARSFGAAVRGHWIIENSCHWQLDMSFGQDRSRIR